MTPSGQTYVIGIDPGLDGAIAFWNIGAKALARVHNFPLLNVKFSKKTRRILDLTAIARDLDFYSNAIVHAFVEKVGSMPKQGIASAFNFGEGFGSIKGILAANFIPVTYVPAAEWKRAMKAPAEKDGARKRASELMPLMAGSWPLVKDDGKAEAAMLAMFGARQLRVV